MQEIVWTIKYFERGLSKSLKIVIFSFEPSPFLWTKLSKPKGPETSDQLLIKLQVKFRKIPLSVMCNMAKFDYVIRSGF